MSHSMTLKYLTELSPGRYEYRRRVPKAARESVGKNEWKRVIEASRPADLARGYARVEGMRRPRPIDFARFRWVTRLREGLRLQMEVLHGGWWGWVCRTV